MVAGKEWAPEMFPFVIVVAVGRTFHVMMVMVRVRIQSLSMRLLLLG